MSETETAPATEKPRPAPAPRPAAAPRPLPTPEDVGAWIEGGEVPVVAALFDRHSLKTFDAMVMQIRRDELLPQHWQVIAETAVPPDDAFEQLPEVGRLRVTYRDHELSRRRLDALRTAWRELRGRRPALWTVADLFAALRRIYEKGLQVDYYDLLTGTRDVWRSSTLPFGRQQLDLLWNVLDFMRKKTKK